MLLPSSALQNDLSNRLRPDPGIGTAAVLLSDDDLLLRCACLTCTKWQLSGVCGARCCLPAAFCRVQPQQQQWCSTLPPAPCPHALPADVPTWSERLPGGRPTSRHWWGSFPALAYPARRHRCAFCACNNAWQAGLACPLSFTALCPSREALASHLPARLPTRLPCLQYLGEKAVFSRQYQHQYNLLLTAAEFVSLDLLRSYWSERYAAGMDISPVGRRYKGALGQGQCTAGGSGSDSLATAAPPQCWSSFISLSLPGICCLPAGRKLVGQLTNCEDILLNFVAAAAIQEQQQLTQPVDPAGGTAVNASAALAAPAEQQAGSGSRRRPPSALWVQPSRRLDISFLSGVGISRRRAVHEGEPGQAAAVAAAPGMLANQHWLLNAPSACCARRLLQIAECNPQNLAPACPLLQPSGGSAWPSLALGTAQRCCRRRPLSGTAAAPGGACWRTPCAACPSWAASICSSRRWGCWLVGGLWYFRGWGAGTEGFGRGGGQLAHMPRLVLHALLPFKFDCT